MKHRNAGPSKVGFYGALSNLRVLRGRMTETDVLLFWVAIGYIILVTIYILPKDVVEFFYQKTLYVDWLPIIRSTDNPVVFDGSVARLHASAMMLASPLMVVSYFYVSKENFLPRATGGNRLALLVIFPLLSIFLMATDISGGAVGRFFVSSPVLFPLVSTVSFLTLGLGARCAFEIVVDN